MAKDNDNENVKDETEAAPAETLSGVEREALARGDNPASLSARVTEADVKAAQASENDPED